MTRYAGSVCLALAVTATAIPGTFGCAARQTGTTIGDEVLQVRVEAVLARASDVHAAGITVDVERGVVTLSGQVASENEQQSLGAIVRAVPGVRNVSFLLSLAEQGALP